LFAIVELIALIGVFITHLLSIVFYAFRVLSFGSAKKANINIRMYPFQMGMIFAI